MDWKETENRLEKTFTFKSFAGAMSWMQRAAFAIEKMDHHPDWTNVYNKVTVKLTTHSAGNKVTESDRKLAEALDRIYSEGFS